MAGATSHLVSVSKNAREDMQYDHPRVNIPCGATDINVFEYGLGAAPLSSKMMLEKMSC